MLAHENANTDENSDSSSDWEQNEDVVVGHSSTEQTVRSKNALVDSLSGSSNSAGSSVLEGSTQQAINLQILNQLGSMGKRLDAIEKKEKKLKPTMRQKLKVKVSDPLPLTPGHTAHTTPYGVAFTQSSYFEKRCADPSTG